MKSKEEQEKKIVMKRMRDVAFNALKKNLIDKKFNQNDCKTWGNNIINEIEEAFKQNFKDYGIIITLYISDIIAYKSNHRSIDYNDTDYKCVVCFHNDYLYSSVRMLITNINSKLDDFLDNINPENSLAINNKMMELLERRKYDDDTMAEIAENLVDSISKMLSEKKGNMPCSFHICYIIESPAKKVYHTYRVFNLSVIPSIFTFSNPHLVGQFILFMINN